MLIWKVENISGFINQYNSLVQSIEIYINNSVNATFQIAEYSKYPLCMKAVFLKKNNKLSLEISITILKTSFKKNWPNVSPGGQDYHCNDTAQQDAVL